MGRCLVALNAAKQGFGDFLAICRVLKADFVFGAAHKRNLGEDRWHGSSGQDGVSSLFDASVASAGCVGGDGSVKRLLYRTREAARLEDLGANIHISPIQVLKFRLAIGIGGAGAY